MSPTTDQTPSHDETPGTSTRVSDTAHRVANSAAEATQECAQHYVTEPAKDLFGLMKDYARDKPDVAAMWAFGLGVVVGWKLKP